MSMPYYVSPEQLMKDRADFARKGIARGRPVLVVSCRAGILLLAHNPSGSLHKIAELYDRMGFAAVGKYNEFETLRQAGVRFADLRGYSYDRGDVTAASVVGAYAQTLAQVFSTESKPFEVELVVAELGATPSADALFRISYDGSVTDETGFVALGGDAQGVAARMRTLDTATLSLPAALRAGIAALAGKPADPADPARSADSAGPADGAALPTGQLEAALLDRTTTARRTFVRLPARRVARLLEEE